MFLQTRLYKTISLSTFQMHLNKSVLELGGDALLFFSSLTSQPDQVSFSGYHSQALKNETEF